MSWELKEALDYYRGQGAPSDQPALVSLLKEIQAEQGGGISRGTVTAVAQAYGIRETFLLAVIKRYPSLRLLDTHCLEICCGENCSRRAGLGAFARKTFRELPEGVEIRYVGCMRMCGKGPNIRWDGQIFHGADEKLIRSLLKKK